MLEILTVPIFNDNYSYIIQDTESQQTAVIDPGDAQPILAALTQHDWPLHYILNTHHHADHVGGNSALQQATGCQIATSRIDQQRILGSSIALSATKPFMLGNTALHIIETPGHTLGHIVYYQAETHALFTGDTLFGLGCGRLFEGSAEQLWQSLQTLSQLPPETHIYCAHEYTQNNGCFALTIEPENIALQQRMQRVNQQRHNQQPTVPSTLRDELATNPFLRTTNPNLQKQLGLVNHSSLAIFTQLRRLKDHF